jgi:hypothetical protein
MPVRINPHVNVPVLDAETVIEINVFRALLIILAEIGLSEERQ